MGKYRNEKPQAVVVGGQVIKPKQIVELDDKAIGLERLVKREVLTKIDARTAEGKKAVADAEKSGQPVEEGK